MGRVPQASRYDVCTTRRRAKLLELDLFCGLQSVIFNRRAWLCAIQAPQRLPMPRSVALTDFSG
jgi:hypothetical protein